MPLNRFQFLVPRFQMNHKLLPRIPHMGRSERNRVPQSTSQRHIPFFPILNILQQISSNRSLHRQILDHIFNLHPKKKPTVNKILKKNLHFFFIIINLIVLQIFHNFSSLDRNINHITMHPSNRIYKPNINNKKLWIYFILPRFVLEGKSSTILRFCRRLVVPLIDRSLRRVSPISTDSILATESGRSNSSISKPKNSKLYPARPA